MELEKLTDERVSAHRLRAPRVRWARFSLRSLLIAITLVAAVLSIFMNRVHEAQRQERALREIEKLGGHPVRFQSYGECLIYVDATGPRLRSQIYDYLVGKEFFTYAPVVVLPSSLTDANIREMIPYIEQVRIKEGCNNGETYLALYVDKSSLDAEFIDYLKRRLPQCRVISPADGNSL